jgi:predicted phage terminase large subunit-like protein
LQELEGRFIDAEGGLFRREWFQVVDTVPKLVSQVRAWDLASTPKDERKATDPDWTVGSKLGRAENGDIFITDLKRLRGSPQQVEATIRQTAEMDGKAVAIWMEEEGGSSGKIVADHYARLLIGYNFHAERSTGDKTTRAMPLAAAAERGLVKVARGHWNGALLDELGLFPHGGHDDQIDACSLAFNKLSAKKTFWMAYAGEIMGKKEPEDEDCVTITDPKTGKSERVPFDPAQHVDLRAHARGWQRFGRFCGYG